MNRHLRRIVVARVGFVALVLITFSISIVGCIFDEGPYHDGKGGGRRTEAPTSQPTQTAAPTGTATTNPPVDSSSGNPGPKDTSTLE